jgi:hypothetical protein
MGPESIRYGDAEGLARVELAGKQVSHSTLTKELRRQEELEDRPPTPHKPRSTQGIETASCIRPDKTYLSPLKLRVIL